MPAMMSRRVRIGIVTAVLLVLIAGIVLATPELVRRRLVAGIEARVVEPVSIDDVDLNLLTGRVRVTGLRVGARAAPLLRVPIVDTELRYWPLPQGQTTAGSAEQMEQVLRERISVSRSDLAELANTRAATVQAALVRRGVPGNRLYVVSEGERAVTTEGAGLVRFEVL